MIRIFWALSQNYEKRLLAPCLSIRMKQLGSLLLLRLLYLSLLPFSVGSSIHLLKSFLVTATSSSSSSLSVPFAFQRLALGPS
jgi:hypothetical protein